MISANKKHLIVSIIISILLLMPFSTVFAWPEGMPVTPYGDFCPVYNSYYGMHRFILSPEDAEKSMVNYYHKKGLSVEIENIRGRFIKAKIKDKDKVIDVIIFDRQTGRIRSIY